MLDRSNQPPQVERLNLPIRVESKLFGCCKNGETRTQGGSRLWNGSVSGVRGSFQRCDHFATPLHRRVECALGLAWFCHDGPRGGRFLRGAASVDLVPAYVFAASNWKTGVELNRPRQSRSCRRGIRPTCPGRFFSSGQVVQPNAARRRPNPCRYVWSGHSGDP